MGFVACYLFCFKQKTAYEMRISDWSSDVCSSDLTASIYKTASARATKNKAALTALAAKAGGASEAADAYLAWGDYARAAELYRAALKQTPADPGQVNTRLGIALARAGNVEEARKALAAVTGDRRGQRLNSRV